MRDASKHHVVIVGGGFAGLRAAHALRNAPVRVTLIDRRNFHLFQPLLYQVATGGLSPADIASPLRAVLRHQKNACVLQGEVTAIDAEQGCVLLEDAWFPFDTLILATGARSSYFGRADWEPLAPGLKSIEDAMEIRRRVFTAFECAERERLAADREPWMTFVVVGGGPTGVELAGAIGELAHHTLPKDFRHIDTRRVKVHLIEGAQRILDQYAEPLSTQATQSLEKLGVTVHTGWTVREIQPEGVVLRQGDRSQSIQARTVLWAAGVHASPLGREVACATGAELDRQGRVVVQPDLTVPGHPHIFVLGDLAHVRQADGAPLPGVAPVAMQQGAYVAQQIRRRLSGQQSQPFRYRDRGSMAVIGRSAAVAQIGAWKLHGFPAWLAWLFVHVVYLVEFQNRLLVTIQWGWNYFTRNRSARLITQTARSQADNGDVDVPSRTDGTLAPLRRCEQRLSSV